MNRLLEILGRGIAVDTAELIWHWLETVKCYEYYSRTEQVERLDRVVELVNNKKLDTAQQQLRLYLFDNPGGTLGRLAAAAICIDKNQIDKAIEELNSVYLRQPNNTMALYALGHCYERLGKDPEAVEFYQDCLKFKNYLQLPRQRLAAIYFKKGQLEKTIQEYELLRKEYPEDISTLVTLGHLYITNGQYTEAVETFDSAILVHPDNFYYHDDKLEQLIRERQFDEALEQLEVMLAGQGERVDLIARQGDVLVMLGATDEAVSQYEKAVRICPDFLEATIRLGTQYLQMHHEQLAAKQFNKAVEINDKIVDAYIGLAIAQKSEGKVSKALATLSLAAAIQPNSSLLFANTATLQFQAGAGISTGACNRGESAEVIEDVIGAHRQQISLCPQNPDLHYRLGLLMMSVARITEATKSFQVALKINPSYTRAKSKLALCLFQTDQKETALEQLAECEYLDKRALELHYKTALLYCDRIKFASSLMNLEHSMENNFACADTTDNVSIVLQNLGLLDRASAMWDNLSDTAEQATNA